jgi:hypothetical protein
MNTLFGENCLRPHYSNTLKLDLFLLSLAIKENCLLSAVRMFHIKVRVRFVTDKLVLGPLFLRVRRLYIVKFHPSNNPYS